MRRLYSTAILFGDGAFDHSCLCHQHERLQLLPRRNGCGDRVHRIRLDWARPELQRSVASLSCVISLELVRAEEDHGRLEGSECVSMLPKERRLVDEELAHVIELRHQIGQLRAHEHVRHQRDQLIGAELCVALCPPSLLGGRLLRVEDVLPRRRLRHAATRSHRGIGGRSCRRLRRPAVQRAEPRGHRAQAALVGAVAPAPTAAHARPLRRR
mmetsp:Transcript_18441/g.45968  ORF Transcript_18441/g.45968 Transcript_18441/m.45968 type:complete len:213 (-) Transcript_18441:881-1519(-)